MTYREFKSINDRMKNSGALSNYCRIKSVDVKNGICVIDMLGNSSAIKTQSTSISGLVDAVLRGSTREEVYRILPFERFIASFEFYHTQGWDFVIDAAIKTFETNDFVI